MDTKALFCLAVLCIFSVSAAPQTGQARGIGKRSTILHDHEEQDYTCWKHGRGVKHSTRHSETVSKCHQRRMTPDPEDCSAYSVCVPDHHGIYKTHHCNCEKDYSFSATKQQCVLNEATECVRKNVGEAKLKLSQLVLNKWEQKELQSGGRRDEKLDHLCHYAGRFAVIGNCSVYVQCGMGAEGRLEAFVHECPEGKEYGRNFRLCMHPALARCEDSPVTRSSTSFPVSPSTPVTLPEQYTKSTFKPKSVPLSSPMQNTSTHSSHKPKSTTLTFPASRSSYNNSTRSVYTTLRPASTITTPSTALPYENTAVYTPKQIHRKSKSTEIRAQTNQTEQEGSVATTNTAHVIGYSFTEPTPPDAANQQTLQPIKAPGNESLGNSTTNESDYRLTHTRTYTTASSSVRQTIQTRNHSYGQAELTYGKRISEPGVHSTKPTPREGSNRAHFDQEKQFIYNVTYEELSEHQEIQEPVYKAEAHPVHAEHSLPDYSEPKPGESSKNQAHPVPVYKEAKGEKNSEKSAINYDGASRTTPHYEEQVVPSYSDQNEQLEPQGKYGIHVSGYEDRRPENTDLREELQYEENEQVEYMENKAPRYEDEKEEVDYVAGKAYEKEEVDYVEAKAPRYEEDSFDYVHQDPPSYEHERDEHILDYKFEDSPEYQEDEVEDDDEDYFYGPTVIAEKLTTFTEVATTTTPSPTIPITPSTAAATAPTTTTTSTPSTTSTTTPSTTTTPTTTTTTPTTTTTTPTIATTKPSPTPTRRTAIKTTPLTTTASTTRTVPTATTVAIETTRTLSKSPTTSERALTYPTKITPLTTAAVITQAPTTTAPSTSTTTAPSSLALISTLPRSSKSITTKRYNRRTTARLQHLTKSTTIASSSNNKYTQMSHLESNVTYSPSTEAATTKLPTAPPAQNSSDLHHHVRKTVNGAVGYKLLGKK